MLVDQTAILRTSFNSTPALELGFLRFSQVKPDTLPGILSNAQTDSFRRLDQRSCIEAYSPIGFGAHSDVVVVTSSSSESGRLFAWGSEDIQEAGGSSTCCNEIYPYRQGQFSGSFGDWLCSSDAVRPEATWIGSCNFNKLLADPNSWHLHGQKVDYCLSQQIPEACSIGFVPHIMIVVLVFNGLKVLVALYMITRPRIFIAENLSSVGDAVSSFLHFFSSQIVTQRPFVQLKRHRYQMLNSKLWRSPWDFEVLWLRMEATSMSHWVIIIIKLSSAGT